jgi:hypothetical protein
MAIHGEESEKEEEGRKEKTNSSSTHTYAESLNLVKSITYQKSMMAHKIIK